MIQPYILTKSLCPLHRHRSCPELQQLLHSSSWSSEAWKFTGCLRVYFDTLFLFPLALLPESDPESRCCIAGGTIRTRRSRKVSTSRPRIIWPTSRRLSHAGSAQGYAFPEVAPNMRSGFNWCRYRVQQKQQRFETPIAFFARFCSSVTSRMACRWGWIH